MNPIGNKYAHDKSLKLANALKDMFTNNKYLVHLDLSYCDLTKPECFKMNEGLLSNHSILGLHMSGNELDTDSNGFITEDQLGKPCGSVFLARLDDTLETGKL